MAPRPYAAIAEAVRRRGADPLGDLAELWRRIVFTVLISNSDDHLRNHGFLRAAGGRRLSSAYDLNGSRAPAGSSPAATVPGGFEVAESLGAWVEGWFECTTRRRSRQFCSYGGLFVGRFRRESVLGG